MLQKVETMNGKQVQGEGKRKREGAVDCNKATGNSVRSWASAYRLLSLLSFPPYRCVTGHGKNRFLPLESPVNGTCLEKTMDNTLTLITWRELFWSSTFYIMYLGTFKCFQRAHNTY